MGYALPLNVVLGTVENLMRRAENKAPINDQVTTNNHGYNKCLLGITVRATENIAEYDEESGLLTYRQVITVMEVSETGASKGYLLAGDVVMTVEINGVKRNIARMYQIGDTLLYAARGDVAKVTVLRGGETITVEIPLNIATYMA